MNASEFWEISPLASTFCPQHIISLWDSLSQDMAMATDVDSSKKDIRPISEEI